MTDITIDRMASDLGICRFAEESSLQFKCRVIYSAMASWIKAIAMDQPPGSKEEGFYGVSRKHMYERSRTVLDTFCRMYPEIKEWFDLTETGEHPVILLRTRLLNHGDLLNEGFDTNVALSSVHSMQLTPKIETVYGEIMGESLQYSGIAVVRCKEADIPAENAEVTQEWIEGFLKEAWWSLDMPDTTAWQYFNPSNPAKNNYSAWQDSMVEAVYGIVLARAVVNKYGYEYYLLKTKDKLMHKLDPFLQELGYHIRIMYALRAGAGNRAVAAVKRHDGYVTFRLNAHLPLKETGLLESYAWPCRNINDNLGWIMSDFIWHYIEPYIGALGIRILEDSDG